MAPALSANPTATTSDATATSQVSQPAFSQVPPLAAIVLTILLVVMVSVVCGVAVYRLVQECLTLRAYRAKKERAIRPFVLRSGSSEIKPVPGSQGPKPLLLPTMPTVRSSRSKASLASKFLGRWGATHVHQIKDVECAPSPTLVGSCEEDKLKGHLDSEWIPRQLYWVTIPRDIPPLAPIIPVAITSSKSLALTIAEDLPALKLEQIPEDELSVDIVEGSPSVSGSAFGSLLAADVDSPADAASIPTIVVHNCSRPASAALDVLDADDLLCVPPPLWCTYLDEETEETEADVYEET
ncbi:hypothetical protein DAEQUDRAFT_757292 [Daedalea quercina L-15889]|uniref:Uncharacterized protein n=1 Tax=Daedalea quercina L-15889 TaxID=1314783 RepID=A0A165Q1L1_9APHY|nr:hypothetical protein DAEQUDRAFT_757292 [Daedalea quercina L-15889]